MPVAGQRYGKLVFVRELPWIRGQPRRGEWRCDCGRASNAVITHVVNGRTRSCGCSRAAINWNRRYGKKFKVEGK